METTKFHRQRDRGLLSPGYIFYRVDQSKPLYDLIVEAKALVEASGTPIVFNYREHPVRVNQSVDVEIILQAWEGRKQRAEKNPLRTVYADGEEYW